MPNIVKIFAVIRTLFYPPAPLVTPCSESLQYTICKEISEHIRKTHPHLAPQMDMPEVDALKLILQYIREVHP